ncbi:MAG: hypothetical protein R3F61_13810 [Myxococcota bacterium]
MRHIVAVGADRRAGFYDSVGREIATEATMVIQAALLLAGCRNPVKALEVGEAARVERAALLSVSGSGPDDVWVVGARPDALSEATVLRHRGGAWEPVSTGVPHDLWWVHAGDDGTAWLGGAGATVLEYDGSAFVRHVTPGFAGQTVYGVWAQSPSDVWAVGGFAGREGFAWHYDGSEWATVALPDDLPRTRDGEIPPLLKVWGRTSDDVWLVGGLGTILHYDGTALVRVESGTTEQLFTVHGDADTVVVVGGGASGILLRNDGDGFVDDTPPSANLLQGLHVDRDGVVWTAGERGRLFGRHKSTWAEVELDVEAPQSYHALWTDGEGDLWAVGGTVLSPALDAGIAISSVSVDLFEPEVVEPPTPTCPAAHVDPTPDRTIARRWNEQLLGAIRRDIPNPPVHARNLLHVSMAMYDAWAAYQDVAHPVEMIEGPFLDATPEDRDIAISYAAYRVLAHRYEHAQNAAVSLDCFDGFMDVLGFDPSDTHTDGDDPIAVGNRIGQGIVARFLDDGCNEANGYADTTGWQPTNPVLVVDRPGTPVDDPDVWQQLNLALAETQNGIVLEDTVQPYIGPHWRNAETFAAVPDPTTGLYGGDPGPYPTVDDPEMVDWVVQVIRRTSELDFEDGVTIDISPGGLGGNPLGTNDGTGHALNPATGQPYTPVLVPRGDFARVVAEMWADGPTSETPPGHWVKISNEVSDALEAADRIPFAEGEPVDRLAWDVGIYLTVTGATHDAAIAAWELKRDSLGPRPITLVRWMAQNGQRSEPEAPDYHPQGLPLVPGVIERITEASSAPGERHFDLRWHVGELAVWSWPGEPGDRANQHTSFRWMRALDWIPYQRRTFVTPAFPGFVSGHSTFSRAAAEALTAYTGSPWFPGGLGQFCAPQDGYLVFENGPSVDTCLQWGTYYDAADQAGQSRLYGGIHIWPDDTRGRVIGSHIGLEAADRARTLVKGL